MIVIDRREAKEAKEHHNISIPDVLNIPCAVDTLYAGDYAFMGRTGLTGIERCEIGNLVDKLATGELERQLYKCQEHYQTLILLTEGVYDRVEDLLAIHKLSSKGYYRVRVFPHTRFDHIKALEIRLSELGIEVIHSPNFDCSMTVIRTIYNQRTKPEEAHTLFKKVRPVMLPTKLTANPAVPKLMALCPRLPEKVAITLIHKYDTIWAILNAPDRELIGVEGFGRTLLKRLKEGVGKDG